MNVNYIRLVIICGGSFCATMVFLLSDKVFWFKNFSNHASVALNLSSAFFFGLYIISFREILNILLQRFSIHSRSSSPLRPSRLCLTCPVEVLFILIPLLLLRHSLTFFQSNTTFF